MENEKDLKFICRDIPINFMSEIGYEFDQLRQCLKSENVDLDIKDVYRFFDIFLRLVGLGRRQDEKEFQGILSQCAPVHCKDVSEKLEDSAALEQFKNAVISADSLMDEPFKDLDTILNNIPILMKEYSIFWNNIITYALDKLNQEKCMTYTLETSIPDNVSRMLKMSLFNDKYGIGLSILVFSTLTSMSLSDKVSIIADSYPKEIAEKLIAGEKNE